MSNSQGTAVVFSCYLPFQIHSSKCWLLRQPHPSLEATVVDGEQLTSLKTSRKTLRCNNSWIHLWQGNRFWVLVEDSQCRNLPSFQSQGMLLSDASSGHQRERVEPVQALHTYHKELIQAPRPQQVNKDRTMEADSRPAQQGKLDMKAAGAILRLQVEPVKQRNSISWQSSVLRSFLGTCSIRPTDFLLQADPGDRTYSYSLQLPSRCAVMLNFQISKVNI